MKKFIVFSFSQYYPCGGLGDIQNSFDELFDAIDFAKKETSDYVYIVNRDTWGVVWDNEE